MIVFTWIMRKHLIQVPHRRLIYKLSNYGINNKTVSWIKKISWSNRFQQVVVQGEESTWIAVTSGIPQGSVLGPLLIVVFKNDLPGCVTSDAFLFADDTKIFSVIIKKEDREELQKDLTRLDQWSKDWLLKCPPTEMQMYDNWKG